VNEERMRPDQWLALVLCVTFGTLTLRVGWQERIPACKSPVRLILGGFVPEKVEEEDPRGNRLTQVHVKKRPLNGSNSRSSSS